MGSQLRALRVVADTSVLVDYLSGHEAARAWLASMPDNAIGICPLTIVELHAWPHAESRLAPMENLVEACTLVPLDSDVSKLAGNLCRTRGLSLADAAIAATALFHGVPLATADKDLIAKGIVHSGIPYERSDVDRLHI